MTDRLSDARERGDARHAGPVTTTGGPWASRLRMRSLLLLAMLVPALGFTILAASSIDQRLGRREVSSALQAATEELGGAVGFRAAVAREQVHATALGLANDLGLRGEDLAVVTGGQLLPDLDDARAEVEAGRRRYAGPRVDAALGALDDLQARLAAGSAGRDDVATTFMTLNQALAEESDRRMQRIEDVADQRPLDGEVRARLRTLRASLDAFHQGAPRINAALETLLGQPTPATLADLSAADARFAAAAGHARPEPGTRAAAAWEAFRSDPAADATEAVIRTARQIALGERPPLRSTDGALVIAGLQDGERWGNLLIATVEAAAGDLSDAAGARAAADDDAVRDQVLQVAVLVLLTIAVSLWTSRTLVRPVSDLEAAARRVARGEFDLPAVPAGGPREVAATVEAFNDMAATLAAVEDHAVALAEDPTAAALDDPLPGRTGQAMQAAIDRLRRSVEDAERHRIELFELATRDGLTGLRNRAAAYSEIERELARAQRDGRPLLAVYVDLDGLKGLNDVYGHQAGDDAIVRTADALRATTRDADVVARLGGDEFLVVGPVPDGGPGAAVAFAERIHEAVRDQRVAVTDGHQVTLRCSVGIALSSPAADTAEALIRAADVAMYRAKAGGRDLVVEHLA